MIVGTTTVDITPEANIEICGYAVRVQPSVGIHDRLSVHGLYIENNGEKLLWLHADLIGFDRTFVRQFRDIAEKRFGIQRRRIILSATHTHSAPAAVHLINLGACDKDYMEFLKNRLEEAAAAAIGNTEETTLVAAEGKCALSVDRRRKASAHVDHRVGVMAWVRDDHSYAAVLCNYAMHNVGLGPENRWVSGDIAGVAAKAVKRRLPGNPTVLLTNGACGNIDPPFLTTDFNTIHEWGNTLAESVTSSLADARTPKEQKLQFRSQTFNIPLDSFDRTQIKDFADRCVAKFEHWDPYSRDRCREAANRWKQSMIERMERKNPLTETQIELAVISLGRVYWVCINAEIFSLFTEGIRQAIHHRVYTVGYSNGVIGYIPTAAAYEEGGYEVEETFIFYDTFRPQKGVLETIRQRAIEMIQGQTCPGSTPCT